MYIYGCKAIVIEPGAHKTPIFAAENLKRNVEVGWNKTTADIKAEFGQEYLEYC